MEIVIEEIKTGMEGLKSVKEVMDYLDVFKPIFRNPNTNLIKKKIAEFISHLDYFIIIINEKDSYTFRYFNLNIEYFSIKSDHIEKINEDDYVVYKLIAIKK